MCLFMALHVYLLVVLQETLQNQSRHHMGLQIRLRGGFTLSQLERVSNPTSFFKWIPFNLAGKSPIFNMEDESSIWVHFPLPAMLVYLRIPWDSGNYLVDLVSSKKIHQKDNKLLKVGGQAGERFPTHLQKTVSDTHLIHPNKDLQVKNSA